MATTPNPEIRVVKGDGTLGEILPDWRTLEYLDDTMDIGSVSFEYPEHGGLRRHLLDGHREYALLLDGQEVDNGRFIVDGSSGNRASDTPGYISWVGKTLIALLEKCIIGPADGPDREDVLTPEERNEFVTTRKDYVRTQMARLRKADRLEGFTASDSGEPASLQTTAASRSFLDDYDGSDSETGQKKKLLQGFDYETTKTDAYDKLDPRYWREKFEPGDAMQARMDTAPPPVGQVFRDVTPGHLILRLLEQAQQRGFAEHIRTDFTAKRDSAGRLWAHTVNRRPEVGSSLLELLRSLAERKRAEPRMRGRTLQLFNADYGNPEGAKVLFARGKNIVDGPREQAWDEIVTAVFASSDTGVHGWVSIPELVRKFGWLEGTYEAEGVQTWRGLRRRAQEFIRQQGRLKQQSTFGVTALNTEGTRPYRDFRAGSWVLTALDGGEPEPQRIRAITMSWDENGTMSCGVTLNDRLYEKDVTNERILKKLTGTGAQRARLLSTTEAATSAKSDQRAPSKPSAPQVTSRSGVVEVAAAWTDVDGNDAIWDQEVLEVHKAADFDFQPTSETLTGKLYGESKLTLATEPYDTVQYVRFVAVDKGGDRSDPSETVALSPALITGDDIDIGTLPIPGGEPVAPPTVSDLLLTPLGIGALRGSWTAVENPTSVTYAVWFGSDVDGVTNMVDSYGDVSGSMVALTADPSTGEETLSYAVGYYLRIWSHSGDEWAPEPSPVVGPVYPAQATSGDLAANSVTAANISGNTINGEHLVGQLILGSDITTGLEGERHGLSAAEGHYSYGPDGDMAFRAIGGDVRVSGAIRAKTFEADSATWSGQSIGAPGSSTMMATSLSPPANPPTVEPVYQTLLLDDGDVVGDLAIKRTGLIWWNDHWFVGTRMRTGQGEGTTPALLEFEADGNLFHIHRTTWLGQELRSIWLARYGRWIYLDIGFVIISFDVVEQTYGTLSVGRPFSGPESNGVFGLGSGGFRLTWRGSDNVTYWREYFYDTDGTYKPGPDVVNTGQSFRPRTILGGSSFGIGTASRVVIVDPSTAHVFTENGGYQSSYAFPCLNSNGLAWREDTEQFYTLGDPKTILIHPNTLIGNNRTSDLYVGQAWRDWAGEQHSTALGFTRTATFWQRAGHRLRTASPVPGEGGDDDPNGAAFYVGRQNIREAMELQPGEPAPGVGEIAELELFDDLKVPSGANAVSPPPVEGDFPQWTPYDHFSQALIPGTSTPQVTLKGDGTAILYGHRKPWASRKQPNAQPIPRQVSTAILWPTGMDDEAGAIIYNPDGSFTITQPGVYQVSVQVYIDTAATSGYAGFNVFLNGTSVQGTRIYPSGGDFPLPLPALKFRLVAGDVFDTKVYANIVGGTSLLADERMNWIEITRDSL